jgi:hypothetical protein
VTLLQGCDGLSARRMALLWTFHEVSLSRHVRRELMRNALLDFTPMILATACHQRNYVETYSRFILTTKFTSTKPAEIALIQHLAEEADFLVAGVAL